MKKCYLCRFINSELKWNKHLKVLKGAKDRKEKERAQVISYNGKVKIQHMYIVQTKQIVHELRAEDDYTSMYHTRPYRSSNIHDPITHTPNKTPRNASICRYTSD